MDEIDRANEQAQRQLDAALAHRKPTTLGRLASATGAIDEAMKL